MRYVLNFIQHVIVILERGRAEGESIIEYRSFFLWNLYPEEYYLMGIYVHRIGCI